tara:strand:+ start:4106 stop:4774 length:669 start_codon:yes stop_codon:yes gene_type:complete
MPTYSSAIADGTPDPQKPVATPPRRPRAKEFWEVEPGDPGTEGWSDNPEDPTGPQIGNPAAAAPVVAPTPPTPPAPAPQMPVVVTAPQSTTSKDKYVEFVNQVTSEPSKDPAQFISRIATLQASGCEVQRLLTAAVGMSAEAGEFTEIVKKVIFQGKPWDADNIEHLKVELGDVLWYAAQACMALDVSFEEVQDRNIEKLSKRYPTGTFDAYYSENRKAGDI